MMTTCKRTACRSPACANHTPPPAPRFAVGDLVICPLVFAASTRIGKVTLVDATGGLDEQPSYGVDLGSTFEFYDESALMACDGPHVDALKRERDLLRVGPNGERAMWFGEGDTKYPKSIAPQWWMLLPEPPK